MCFPLVLNLLMVTCCCGTVSTHPCHCVHPSPGKRPQNLPAHRRYKQNYCAINCSRMAHTSHNKHCHSSDSWATVTRDSFEHLYIGIQDTHFVDSTVTSRFWNFQITHWLTHLLPGFLSSTATCWFIHLILWLNESPGVQCPTSVWVFSLLSLHLTVTR